MMPSHRKKEVLTCHTDDYDPLNTSDHVSVSISIGLGNIPQGAVEGLNQCKLRWDKLTPETHLLRYQTPLDDSLGLVYNRVKDNIPNENAIDTLMQELIDKIKQY